jgi:hypothetical protein
MMVKAIFPVDLPQCNSADHAAREICAHTGSWLIVQKSGKRPLRQ